MAGLIEHHADEAAHQIAEACAWRGEIDRAFEWLERAYIQRDSGMVYLATDWFLVPLRDDPRWRPLMRKMGFA